MNFQSGEILKNVSVTMLDDSYVERTEYFILKIESMERVVTYPVSTAVVAMQDNDGNLNMNVFVVCQAAIDGLLFPNIITLDYIIIVAQTLYLCTIEFPGARS